MWPDDLDAEPRAAMARWYNASVELAETVARSLAEEALQWPADEVGDLLDGG